MTTRLSDYDLKAEMLALRTSTEPSDKAFIQWFDACSDTTNTTEDHRELLRQRMNSATAEPFSRLLDIAAHLVGKSWKQTKL